MSVVPVTSPSEPSSHEASGTPNRPAVGRPFSVRGFTSMLLTMAFLSLAISGVMLFLMPRGRVAHWSDWSLLGLGKEQWGALHINLSILFVVVSVLHLTLNWSLFCSYLVRKAHGLYMRKELAAGAIVFAGLVAGTLFNLPPFRSVMTLNYRIKDYWEGRTVQAPVPHAEQMTLAELSGFIRIPLPDMIAALNTEGFDAGDGQRTVREIGLQKQSPPQVVFAAVQKHYPDVALGIGQSSGGRGQGMGKGHAAATGIQAENAGKGCSAGRSFTGATNGGKRSAYSEFEAAGGGPGFGGEQGRGMGMGRGRGMGPGGGRGMGLGLGTQKVSGTVF